MFNYNTHRPAPNTQHLTPKNPYVTFVTVKPKFSYYLCTRKRIRMNFIQKNKLNLLGIIVGSIAGYLYYYFVGCASGTCRITSSPINSTLYGALMGFLLFSMFKPKEK